MEKRMRLTKFMGYLSAIFLAYVFICYLISPHDMNSTVNYCFSDTAELKNFETQLNEKNISFSQVSDTTIKISKENKKQADSLFNKISTEEW